MRNSRALAQLAQNATRAAQTHECACAAHCAVPYCAALRIAVHMSGRRGHEHAACPTSSPDRAACYGRLLTAPEAGRRCLRVALPALCGRRASAPSCRCVGATGAARLQPQLERPPSPAFPNATASCRVSGRVAGANASAPAAAAPAAAGKSLRCMQWQALATEHKPLGACAGLA
eukprot:350457-Chlamydomonas_euryale.AAC.2